MSFIFVFFFACALSLASGFRVTNRSGKLDVYYSIADEFNESLFVHPSIAIKYSDKKGFGVFAREAIPANKTMVLFSHDSRMSAATVCDLVEKLMQLDSAYTKFLERLPPLVLFDKSLQYCDEGFAQPLRELNQCWTKLAVQGNSEVFWNKFQSVYSAVKSRAGSAPQNHPSEAVVMYPVVDFANHCFEQESNTDLFIERGRSSLVSMKTIEPGEEVCYRYRESVDQVSFLAGYNIFPGIPLQGSILTTITGPGCRLLFELPSFLERQQIENSAASVRAFCSNPEAFLLQELEKTVACLKVERMAMRFFIKKMLAIGALLQEIV